MRPFREYGCATSAKSESMGRRSGRERVFAGAARLGGAVLEFCVHVVGLPAVPSAVFGYLVGGVLQYVLCSLWVFPTSLKSDAAGFTAFTILSLVGLGITWIVMLIAHDGAGLPVEIAKVGAVGLAFSWNFLSRKYLRFRAEGAV